MTIEAILRVLALLTWGTACQWASAALPSQCSNGYWSGQQCAKADQSLRYYGPAPEPGTGRQAAPYYGGELSRPVPHIEFLSPACQRLSEAMRTAPARGLRYDVISSLRREWSETCREDDSIARQRYMEKVGEKRSAERAARDASEAAAAAQRMETGRCQSMYGLMRERRARFDSINAAEQQEFKAFEANIRSRCQSQ